MDDLNRLASYLGDVNEARNKLRAVIKAVLTPRQVAHLDALAAKDLYDAAPVDSQQAIDAWIEWRRCRDVARVLDEHEKAVAS